VHTRKFSGSHQQTPTESANRIIKRFLVTTISTAIERISSLGGLVCVFVIADAQEFVATLPSVVDIASVVADVPAVRIAEFV
jgi:hypothetical protein